MLKILFSPSEGKNIGGNFEKNELFGTLQAREETLNRYNSIVLSENKEAIQKLFGIKKWSECEKYIVDIFNSPLLPAIERYSGVAYDYLQYSQLDKSAQEYLKTNTIIFSNLYGPLRGGDKIALYKVKQGNSVAEIAPEKFYKERFSYMLDLELSSCDILDLRASYYEKFYKTKQNSTTLKFLKNGKTLSHWAKAYRGIVLREIAKASVDSLKDFEKLEIEGLAIKEIVESKNKRELVYDIIS